MRGMREGSTTDDYRDAMSGEGGFGTLGYEWSDKPHRLVYDLCGEIDRLRKIESAAFTVVNAEAQGAKNVSEWIAELRNALASR